MQENMFDNLSQELRRKYFSPGWASFDDFYNEQDWNQIFCAEINPEFVVVNGEIRNEKFDMVEAKRKVLNYAANRMKGNTTIYLEFGVREGSSLKYVASCLKTGERELHGFDTFTGLPDGWLPAWGGKSIGRFREPGEMAPTKMPIFSDNRIFLHKGLFQKTLPLLLDRLDKFANRYINIDCDTYSGTLYILTQMHSFLKKGDIVYFDEFHDELNEYAAFNDYVRSYYTRNKFKLIARAYDAYCFEIV